MAEVRSHSKLRWAVLGTGKFVTSVAIPAMQHATKAHVVGIASRSQPLAEAAAFKLQLPKHYGSYDEAINDPDIDVIYNGLPNHLHVEWSIRAAQAGKHVLCEKPLALTSVDCDRLIEVRNATGVTIGEAFMIRHHPQWKRVLSLTAGGIGEVRSVLSTFSYNNRNASDIRNQLECGGGALWDIGCYLVLVSRMVFRSEPQMVHAVMDFDPQFHVDRLTSAVLMFPTGQAVFTCGTQMTSFQNVQIVGTAGRVEVQIPFNAPMDRPCTVVLQTGKFPGELTLETFEANQYAVQADDFCDAIEARTSPATSLEDARRTIQVIEALFASARSGKPVPVA